LYVTVDILSPIITNAELVANCEAAYSNLRGGWRCWKHNPLDCLCYYVPLYSRFHRHGMASPYSMYQPDLLRALLEIFTNSLIAKATVPCSDHLYHSVRHHFLLCHGKR